jgi:hypothetical protein
MSYPIIHIPEEIFQIKNKIPESIAVPQKPNLPKKVLPIEPIKPEKPSGFFTGFLISVTLISIGILVLKYEPFWGILFLGSGILILINFFKYKSEANKEYEKRQIKHIGDNNKYFNDLLTYEDNFIRSLGKNHNIELPKFKREYAEFLYRTKEIESKLYIQQFKFNNILNYFLSTSIPVEINYTNFNKGATEDFFYDYLKKYFYDNVLKNHGILESGFDGTPYIPDFIIHIEELNLYFDIEIDEPYSVENTPIHFVNGSDMFRNTFFNNNRWIVIRFAEIQIIRQPEQCCELVQNVISFIFDDSQTKLDNIKSLIKNIPRWTESDAQWYAEKHLRNLYNQNNFAEDIIDELIELKRKLLVNQHKEKNVLPF